MPNEINPETILSTTEKPLTLLRWLRAIQKTNAQITEKLNELEGVINGKVAKAGDTMTGDLSVPNINVSAEANIGSLNVEKINSTKINQNYAGAIKAELHVDEEGIVEFVNGSNAGRFDTAKVIKPSEVKTEIYDNQQGKRMFFRLPYLEASAGEHRLLTEEDLGGQGINVFEKSFTDTTTNGIAKLSFKVINNVFLFACVNITPLNTGSGYNASNNVFDFRNFDTELEAVLATFIPEGAFRNNLFIPLSCGAVETSTGSVFHCPAVLRYIPSSHELVMRIYTSISANFNTSLYFSGVLTR